MTGEESTLWAVGFSNKAGKQKSKLPKNMVDRLATLVRELILEGPVQPEWHHYGKLTGKKGECHYCRLHDL